MLEWVNVPKWYIAKSEAMPSGYFKIAYDDIMFWPSWSPDCSTDIEQLKKEAQEIHDSYMKNKS